MDHHGGIDVSLELASGCVVDAQGKIVKEATADIKSGPSCDRCGRMFRSSPEQVVTLAVVTCPTGSFSAVTPHALRGPLGVRNGATFWWRCGFPPTSPNPHSNSYIVRYIDILLFPDQRQ